MELWKKIIETYPELTSNDFINTIVLQDDADGLGAYIEKWDYPQPIPAGLKLGK